MILIEVKMMEASMINRRYTKSVAVLCALMALGLSIASRPAWSQETPFSNVVITETTIGDLESGKYAFKVTVTSVAPRAQIPYHVHSSPGIRYMLEGALTIQWKDRGSQTFSAGSTYFEGEGSNHPSSGMAASNPLDVPSKVLIIELVRID